MRVLKLIFYSVANIHTQLMPNEHSMGIDLLVNVLILIFLLHLGQIESSV